MGCDSLGGTGCYPSWTPRDPVRRTTFFAAVLAVLSLANPPTASSAVDDWQPVLIDPEDGARAPLDPIRLALPNSIDDDILGELALELDQFDVSQIVNVERIADGFALTLVPATPLAPGIHVLRVVQYLANGDIIERGQFAVTVRGESTLAFVANSTVEAASRLSDNELPGLPDENEQTSASSLVQSLGEGSQGSVAGETSILFDSVGLNTRAASGTSDPFGDPDLDIGEFAYEARNTNSSLSAMVGHHSLDHRGLLMEQFHRRGASFSLGSSSSRFAASGFAFRTEPITGAHHGFGIGDPENRVVGSVLTTKPIQSHPEKLSVSAMWLTGEGRDQSGVGVLGDETTSEGDAASLTLQSRLVSDRVRLRGEFARSDYDFDGDDGAFEPRRDDAMSFVAESVPWRAELSESRPGELVLGMEYTKVGLFFASPANPTLPTDKELTRGYLTWHTGGFYLQGSYGREDDNVDDYPLLPKLRTTNRQLSLNWTPQFTSDESGIPQTPWYGLPSLGLSLQNATQSLIEAPDSFFPVNVDRRVRSGSASATFQYRRWAWGVGFTRGRQDDQTSAGGDVDQELFDLNFAGYPNSSVTLSMLAQHGTITDELFGSELRTTLWTGQLNLQLIPDRLTLALSSTLVWNEDQATAVDVRSSNVGFGIDWQMIAARGSHPGLSIFVEGNWRDGETDFTFGEDVEQYQFFAGLRSSWSPNYRAPPLRSP